MWSVYHGAVAMNVWRACISANINNNCDYCLAAPPKILIHRFHNCPKASHAWRYAKTLLYRFVNLPPSDSGVWPDLTW
jgi:hypothetical protein